jgi:PAS domain S-box-containing protein
MKTPLPTLSPENRASDLAFSTMLVFLHLIVLVSIVAVMVTNAINQIEIVFWVSLILGILVAISLVLTITGHSALGRMIVPVGLIAAVTALAIDGFGMHDTAMVALPAALLLGGMLVGRRWLWTFTLLSIIAVTFIGITEIQGWVDTGFNQKTGWDDVLINYVMLIAVASALNIVMKRMEESLERARNNEQAWKLSEERFRVFMETSPAIVIMKDADSRYVYCNPKVENLFGKPAHEILGKTEFDLFPKDEADQFTTTDRLVLETGKAVIDEYAARTPDGEARHWWVFKFPMRDSTGKQYVGLQILDVTERKQAEEALARERDLLHVLMDNVPDTVYFKDRSSRFTRVNDRQARMLGVTSPEDAIGKDDSHFMPSELAKAVLEEEQALIEKGDSLLDRVEYIPLQDGTPRWMSASKAPIRDQLGDITGLVGISRDITERKLAEIERETLIKDLEARNAELERFTYTVSHDLKSPIVTIQGFLGLLEKDVLNRDIDRVKHDILRIKAATHKMHILLGELLELSRIGRLMNPPEEVPFASIVEEATGNVGGQLKNGTISLSVQADLPCVYGDRVRLVEVLQNLLDNACKYMGDQLHPQIEVGCQKTNDGKNAFFVRDNGIGIDPRYHQRIFGLFDKLDPKTEGTGVGLAIVKRIIEVHGGTIWLDSAGLGHGAVFYFTLGEQPWPGSLGT